MNKFGFKISSTRTISIDDKETEAVQQIEVQVPSFKRCMNCGSCTATCSAGQFTAFNIRKIHNLYRWNKTQELAEMLQHCMLCGKCTLVCPRGVNLRSLIIYMRQKLAKNVNE